MAENNPAVNTRLLVVFLLVSLITFLLPYHIADINKYVIMLNVILLVVWICLSPTITYVAAQTVSWCDAESITITDPVSGSVQCQDCLKCPAGEGLSVKCGDFIDSQTPLVCQPCVLGETYSSAYEAGACEDCENCGPYRKTIKPCTLTSKAVCGKCKVDAYEEPMLGMCKPCSPCCNDGNDIVVPDCQVSGVPKHMQCTFMRSEKCGKLNTKAVISTTAAALQTTWPSTVPITRHNETEAPKPADVKSGDKQQVYPFESPTSGATNGPATGSSLNWAVKVAIVVGVLIILAMAVLAAFKYFTAKRQQVYTNDDIEMQGVQTDGEVNDGDGDETDEANLEDALLEHKQVLPLHGADKALESPPLRGTHDDTKTQQVRVEIHEPNAEEAQVPFSVQESPSDSPPLTGTQNDTETQQVKTNDCREADEPNPVDALLEDTQESTGVEETLDSPLPTGTEETQKPGPHPATGFKTIQEPRPGPSCKHHSYTKIQKTTVKEITKTCVTCTTPNCQCYCCC